MFLEWQDNLSFYIFCIHSINFPSRFIVSHFPKSIWIDSIRNFRSVFEKYILLMVEANRAFVCIHVFVSVFVVLIYL